jgi:DNA-binding transcriptional ArsR family regulator
MKHNGERHQFEQEPFERESAIWRASLTPPGFACSMRLPSMNAGVPEFLKRFGVSGPNPSQHLTVLKSAGVVVTHRRGKQVFCSLQMPEVEQVCRMLRKLKRAQVRQSSTNSNWQG